jgi:putative ABC transport system substrate-binding protein
MQQLADWLEKLGMAEYVQRFADNHIGGLLMVPDATIIAHRDLVIALAARYRLPAVYPWRYFVTAGALMSYGVDNIDVLQKAAAYVDRILHGAKPVELPVQASTKFETSVNVKTAKAPGLEVDWDDRPVPGERTTVRNAGERDQRHRI